MILRELKVKMANAGAYIDTIPVIFRNSNHETYYDANCHIIKINNIEHLMIDLIDIPYPKAGNDFDIDGSRPPVEDDTHLALDATIARQNVNIYNNSAYPQIKQINKDIYDASKSGFDYYEKYFDENYHTLVDVINKHYTALGFNICVDKIKDKLKILIQW